MFSRPRPPATRWSLPRLGAPALVGAHRDLLLSTELIFRSRLTWLLAFGPVALVGKTGLLGESTCFVLAGLTLIPLAERLSFVTEEVAGHTNQTIGALLNATFGNAPELLISSAALREGFYRVVQLTLLGSMLTNLLFVFGLSCLVGGLRWQVQELRIVTGNASVGMLALAVAGLALPAALMLSDEMIRGKEEKEYVDKNGDGVSDINDGPTTSMVGFSRFNAVIMIVGYLLYLLFQLGSHKDEFEDLEEEDEEGEGGNATNGTNNSNHDEEDGRAMRRAKPPKTKKKARKNKFCHRLFVRGYRDEGNVDVGHGDYQQITRLAAIQEMESSPRNQESHEIEMRDVVSGIGPGAMPDDDFRRKIGSGSRSLPDSLSHLDDGGAGGGASDDVAVRSGNLSSRRRTTGGLSRRDGEADPSTGGGLTNHNGGGLAVMPQSPKERRSTSNKSHCSDGSEEEPYVVSMGVEDGEEGECVVRGARRYTTLPRNILALIFLHARFGVPSF